MALVHRGRAAEGVGVEATRESRRVSRGRGPGRDPRPRSPGRTCRSPCRPPWTGCRKREPRSRGLMRLRSDKDETAIGALAVVRELVDRGGGGGPPVGVVRAGGPDPARVRGGCSRPCPRRFRPLTATPSTLKLRSAPQLLRPTDGELAGRGHAESGAGHLDGAGERGRRLGQLVLGRLPGLGGERKAGTQQAQALPVDDLAHQGHGEKGVLVEHAEGAPQRGSPSAGGIEGEGEARSQVAPVRDLVRVARAKGVRDDRQGQAQRVTLIAQAGLDDEAGSDPPAILREDREQAWRSRRSWSRRSPGSRGRAGRARRPRGP